MLKLFITCICRNGITTTKELLTSHKAVKANRQEIDGMEKKKGKGGKGRREKELIKEKNIKIKNTDK